MKKISLIALSTIIMVSICPFAASIPRTSDSYNLPSLSYMGYGEISMNTNDQLSLDITSGTIINVYVMTDMQWNTLKNSGGVNWEYQVRFKDTTSVNYVFTATSDDNYYVVFYNKGLDSVYIEYDISYTPYSSYNPNNPSNPYNFPYFQLFLLIGITAAIIAIVLPVAIHNSKKKKNFQVEKVQVKQELPKKSYCNNCGSEILGESNYCRNCGNSLN